MLKKFYRSLYSHFGPQHWWPANSKFEVVVGAILTQNTNWQNVERAIKNLKKEKLLTARAIDQVHLSTLKKAIRPAGFFNQKSVRLKIFTNHLKENHNFSLTKMFSQDISPLREELLSLKGIGPETADSIILYGAEKPIFVVDAYTRRILSRHNVVNEAADYGTIQKVFEKNLTGSYRGNVEVYNEYHALIVRTAKEFCKAKEPNCEGCPLEKFL